jgi:hypothetical protein
VSALHWKHCVGTYHQDSKIGTVELPCGACRVTHMVVVTEVDGAITPTIPDNCVCGHSIDTPENLVAVLDAANRLFTTPRLRLLP